MKKKICLFLSFLWIVTSYAMSYSLAKDLKITLVERQIKDLSLSGLYLVFYVKITNSSRSIYYLSGYDYRFVVDQREYIRLETPLADQIRIAASSDTLLSFPLKITYSLLFPEIKGIEKEDKAICYLAGTVKFSDGRKERGKLPFAFSGEFPIFKSPEIECLSLDVKDITIGGADLSFEVRFKNRNGFELFVDNMRYTLQLGEKLIGEGEIGGDKNIKSHADKVFSLPLLINFFEVGKDVYNILHQPSAVCRFSGELKVRTVWGSLNIPFAKSEKVSISRIP